MSESNERYLVLEHWEYGRRIAAQKLRAWGMYMPEDELRSLVGLALCEAASRYDPARGAKFQTFAYYHLLGTLTDAIEKSARQQALAKNENLASKAAEEIVILQQEQSPETIYVQTEALEKIGQLSSTLEPIERKVIQKYFMEDAPVRRIAQELNCCHSHVSRVKNRAVKTMRRAFCRRQQNA